MYMARKKRPEKRARVEEDGVEGRTGVTWRSPNYVVEMRLPKKVAKLKLHFGSYKTLAQANVARDYGAYLRDSTGKEDPATVGGFCNPDDHPFLIFEFEESPEVFTSLEGSGSRAQARCDEYKSLLELPTNEACKKFWEAAREDIRVAIKSFWSRDPEKFADPPLLNHLPNAEPVDGEIHRTPPPSSSEFIVSPTPGREVGASMEEGSTSFSGALSLEVQISVNGSSFQTLLLTNVPFLTAEQIFMIMKARIDTIQGELLDKGLEVREASEMVDKWLEEQEPRTTLPETIPGFDPQCGAEIP